MASYSEKSVCISTRGRLVLNRLQTSLLGYRKNRKEHLMSESSNHEIERRRSFRLDMEKELVDIAWENPQGQTMTKKVACLDFSRGGLRIDSDLAIDVDTPISVTFKAQSVHNQTLKGKVLRCEQQKTGWFDIALIFETEA